MMMIFLVQMIMMMNVVIERMLFFEFLLRLDFHVPVRQFLEDAHDVRIAVVPIESINLVSV